MSYSYNKRREAIRNTRLNTPYYLQIGEKTYHYIKENGKWRLQECGDAGLIGGWEV